MKRFLALWAVTYLVGLAVLIGYVAIRQNSVPGWDPADDPMELWIGIGVAALLLESAWARWQRAA